MKLKISNVNIGNSGEYYVAAELERRCFVVAVPMSNVDNFDILEMKSFMLDLRLIFLKYL